MAQILVVDDEFSIRNCLTTLLAVWGHETVTAADGTVALKILRQARFDLVLSDIVMQPMDGMELLRKVRTEFPRLPVVLFTGYSSMNTAAEALSLGVFDYLKKPIDTTDLKDVIDHALAATTTDIIVTTAAAADYGKFYRMGSIVAGSGAMQILCDQVEQSVLSGANVLLCGEKGTGKKAIAAAAHAFVSRQKKRPMVTINCAEYSEPVLDALLLGRTDGDARWKDLSDQGALSSAAGGILILQKVDLLPKGTQTKLLKALRRMRLRCAGGGDTPGAADLQVISLSDNSAAFVAEGDLIIPDLLSLIAVFRLEIRPLRERPEDIIPLAIHFCRQSATLTSSVPAIDADLCDILTHYNWPGNAAELQNIVEHMAGRAKRGRLAASDLPKDLLTHIAQSRTVLPADFMKSKYWASLLKGYLRIVYVKSPSHRQPPHTDDTEMPGGENRGQKEVSPAVDFSAPHKIFPFWSMAQSYDRVTAMYLDGLDESSIARTLSADLRIEITAAMISTVRAEAALAAQHQPPAVKRRWIYRYRCLTINNLVKEFMFMEDKDSFLKAKRELAEEIVALAKHTSPDRLCIAVNDALGRNNIGPDLISELETYGLSSRKIKDAARSYAAANNLDEETALRQIADRVTAMHRTQRKGDVSRTVRFLAQVLRMRPGSIDGNDVAFLLEYHNLVDDSNTSATSLMSQIVSGADTRLHGVLHQVLNGAADHIPLTGIRNLIEVIRSHPVMARADLEQVLDYATRYAKNLETRRRLQRAADVPDSNHRKTVSELGTLECLVNNNLSLLDPRSFFTTKEIASAARRQISTGDLQAVLERLNRLETSEEITQLATSIFAGRRFEFPAVRYLDRRFRLS